MNFRIIYSYKFLIVLIIIVAIPMVYGCGSKSGERDGAIRSNLKEDGKVLEKGAVKDKGKQSIKKKAAKKAVKTIAAGAAVKKVKDKVKDKVLKEEEEPKTPEADTDDLVEE